MGMNTGDLQRSALLAIFCILLHYSQIGSVLWMFLWMRDSSRSIDRLAPLLIT